jgi:hypothetical protein
LRVLGLGKERRFEKSPRVLNRAQDPGLQGAKLLWGWRIRLVPPGWLLLMGVDETIERRSGRKIQAKGGYREVLHSTQQGESSVMD